MKVQKLIEWNTFLFSRQIMVSWIIARAVRLVKINILIDFLYTLRIESISGNREQLRA